MHRESSSGCRDSRERTQTKYCDTRPRCNGLSSLVVNAALELHYGMQAEVGKSS